MLIGPAEHQVGMFDDTLEVLTCETLGLDPSSRIDEPNLNLGSISLDSYLTMGETSFRDEFLRLLLGGVGV
jgi:hypothetical protein